MTPVRLLHAAKKATQFLKPTGLAFDPCMMKPLAFEQHEVCAFALPC